jgi:uncharacterized membrane protein YeaQ/YmgE (transglycosylase-associated protein family)
MTATNILSGIVIGIIIGTLGRLILPGRQDIGAIATVAVGIVAALVGTWVSRQLGWENRWPARWDWNWAGRHFTWSWSELAVQLVCAIIGMIIAMALTRTFIADDGPVRRRRKTT